MKKKRNIILAVFVVVLSLLFAVDKYSSIKTFAIGLNTIESSVEDTNVSEDNSGEYTIDQAWEDMGELAGDTLFMCIVFVVLALIFMVVIFLGMLIW